MTLTDQIKRAAHGQWQRIHSALGIPRAYLNPSRHSPCPSCGGRDRYRYTDWQGNGGFICNQCHPQGGSGFDLLMMVHKYDFQVALKDVSNYLGITHDSSPQRQPYTPPPMPIPTPESDQIARLQTLWHEAYPLTQNDLVTAYLTARGIPADTLTQPLPAIRYHPKLSYWHDGQSIGDYPAMLAAITDGGELQGLHITYLQTNYPRDYGEDGTHIPSVKKLTLTTPTGEPLPAKKMRVRRHGAIKGASVALYPASDILGIAEGIETALAARALFGLPIHAALSTYGMKTLAIPAAVQTLYIVADHDKAGKEAAAYLARRALKTGKQAHIWTPPQYGTDALDHLNQQQEKSA